MSHPLPPGEGVRERPRNLPGRVPHTTQLLPNSCLSARELTYNQTMQSTRRTPYLWDYELDREQFLEILNGQRTQGRLNQDWAARRLLDTPPTKRSSACSVIRESWRTGPAGAGESAQRAANVGSIFLCSGSPKNTPSCSVVNDPAFHLEVLYPLQDRTIRAINQTDTGFYLTGGTAASRGYLQHRFSDDLDYFLNDDPRFGLWVERVIQALNKGWKCEILVKEERYARLNISQEDVFLKIELVNDVPSAGGRHSKSPRSRAAGQRRKHSRQQGDRPA